MDFKRALELVTRDPDWMKKCFMAGIVILVPIAGIIALFGWQRRIFEGVRQGQETLPDPSFGEDLKYGVDPFIALLNPLPFFFLAAALLFGIPAALMMIGGAIGGDAGSALAMVGSLTQLVAMLFWFLMIVGLNLVLPEMLRRGFRGERFPLFSPRVSIAAIRGNITPYVMLILSSLAANFVGGLGVYACCVGVFLTQSAASAFYTHMLAQWDEKVGG